MARKIAKLDKSKTGPGCGLYPWSRWFDGSAWELTSGTDFVCSADGIRQAAYMAARRMGLRVAVRIRGNKVQLQATKRT